MKRTRNDRICAALLALTLLLTGCSAAVPSASPDMEATQSSGKIPDAVPAPAETTPSPDEAASAAEEMPPMRQLEVDYNARAHAAEAAEAAGGEAAPAEAETQPADPELPEPAAEEEGASNEAPSASNGLVVVIDPGHQLTADLTQEPIGPGAAETKYKVSGGTASCNTGSPESELTLAVSKLLEAELVQRGYTVLMTRTEQDVNISNSERAAVANDANADAFVRIHANGSENSGANGALTICQTAANPYNSDLYAKSRALSDAVLDELTANAGCRKEYVWETDTMSGINWCRVPVTIVEIGYMTNAAEDALLATDDYRSLIAVGIANGIDRYFRELSEN